MRKLTLRLDDLRIESFDLSEDEVGRGTVPGHQETIPAPGCTRESIQCGTCYVSCHLTACPLDC